MIGFLIRTSLKLLGLSVILYVTFFVAIGELTLWEHLRRIAGSDEARDLTSELGNVMNRVKNVVSEIDIGNRTRKVDN
jgi:hypothetical protein